MKVVNALDKIFVEVKKVSSLDEQSVNLNLLGIAAGYALRQTSNPVRREVLETSCGLS